MNVHFMGIGGSGISGIARMAKDCGFIVTGCDMEENGITYRLRKEGIPVEIGHSVDHIHAVDILAHTPAVFYQNEAHEEYKTAKDKKIAMIWEEFMAKYLQKDKKIVAIAGTHGKGHTAAMVSLILEEAGLDPMCEIGANLLNWDKKNYRLGKGELFVCEADEYREKFLLYKPSIAVITSIEMDHPDYFKDFASVLNAFVKFSLKSKTLIVNEEDKGCNELLKILRKQKFKGKIVKYRKITRAKAKLKLPGGHVRSDAGAARAVGLNLGVSEKVIKRALENFEGLERRFEYKGEFDGVRLYDDYAHHPTAILENIKGVREIYPKRRIFVVFQPHMYSRLSALFPEFVTALSKADRVVVSDVYTKRESSPNKPSAKDLALAIKAPKATYVGGDLLNVANFVHRNSQRGDVVVLMGAGDITKVSELILSK